MSRSRLAVGLVVAVLLGGCANEPSPFAPTTGAPPVTTASPGPATPGVTPAASAPAPSIAAVEPSPPIATPAQSPPRTSARPAAAGGFSAPRPSDPGAAWKGIRWQKLAPSNPLGHVRTVTRWRDGFIATGDMATTGSSARNKVWTSADGATWEALDPEVFGPTAMVVGVGGTAGGVVALTLQSGAWTENGSRTEPDSWSLVGPWQSWTSSDGRTWTAHPGPDFSVPREMTGQAGQHPTIVAGVGNDLLAIALGGQPLAFSADGVAWQTASLEAYPGGPAGWQAVAVVGYAPGFVAVGTDTDQAHRDRVGGRPDVDEHPLPADCSPEELTVGSAGMVVIGSVGDPHTPVSTWCTSPDGRAWRELDGYPPLGASRINDECRGVCPNGILIGDGERMLAYRGFPKQAGWISLDGRSWQPLAFPGSAPTGWREPVGYEFTKILTPMGLLVIKSEDGSAWFGSPLT